MLSFDRVVIPREKTFGELIGISAVLREVFCQQGHAFCKKCSSAMSGFLSEERVLQEAARDIERASGQDSPPPPDSPGNLPTEPSISREIVPIVLTVASFPIGQKNSRRLAPGNPPDPSLPAQGVNKVAAALIDFAASQGIRRIILHGKVKSIEQVKGGLFAGDGQSIDLVVQSFKLVEAGPEKIRAGWQVVRSLGAPTMKLVMASKFSDGWEQCREPFIYPMGMQCPSCGIVSPFPKHQSLKTEIDEALLPIVEWRIDGHSFATAVKQSVDDLKKITGAWLSVSQVVGEGGGNEVGIKGSLIVDVHNYFEELSRNGLGDLILGEKLGEMTQLNLLKACLWCLGDIIPRSGHHQVIRFERLGRFVPLGEQLVIRQLLERVTRLGLLIEPGDAALDAPGERPHSGQVKPALARIKVVKGQLTLGALVELMKTFAGRRRLSKITDKEMKLEQLGPTSLQVITLADVVALRWSCGTTPRSRKNQVRDCGLADPLTFVGSHGPPSSLGTGISSSIAHLLTLDRDIEQMFLNEGKRLKNIAAGDEVMKAFLSCGRVICSNCSGRGFRRRHHPTLGLIGILCEVCGGHGVDIALEKLRVGNHSIFEIYRQPLHELLLGMPWSPRSSRVVKSLIALGLGDLTLGNSFSALSIPAQASLGVLKIVFGLPFVPGAVILDQVFSGTVLEPEYLNWFYEMFSAAANPFNTVCIVSHDPVVSSFFDCRLSD